MLLPWLFWFLIERGEFFYFLLFIYVGYEERLRWAERRIDIFLVLVGGSIPFEIWFCLYCLFHVYLIVLVSCCVVFVNMLLC